jgi:FkbM family methyltransferase
MHEECAPGSFSVIDCLRRAYAMIREVFGMRLREMVNNGTHVAVQRIIHFASSDGLIRLGTDYGGWWVPASSISAESVVYSAGVGEDVSFDLALIDRFGCEVWAMDPTPRSIEFARGVRHPRFHFLPIGLWREEADLRFYAPANRAHVSHSILNIQRTQQYFTAHCLPLRAFMDQLGHDHVDLLKMDIEGAEGLVLDALLEDEVRPRILCVEFDAIEPPSRVLRRLRRLGSSGYVLRKADRRCYTLTWEGAASTYQGES